jgi:hypothetical protein
MNSISHSIVSQAKNIQAATGCYFKKTRGEGLNFALARHALYFLLFLEDNLSPR